MTTIAAIATPPATGGVSMIRISGGGAIDVAARIFRPSGSRSVADMTGYTAAYGQIVSGEKRLDDGVLLVFRAPHSYTGEDVAEITCHGGIYISRQVLQACIDAGAKLAEAGEFTKRAMLNGKLSLTQAEAVIDVINAGSKEYLACSNAQKDGALYRRTERIADEILSISTEISAWIDYPDETEETYDTSHHLERLNSISADIEGLLESYESGRILRDGIVTAIVGKPNVGKSTLMNLLVGSERSIVTDIEGTTRDIVEESVRIGGVVLRLSDCAGLRESGDKVEEIGVQLMYKRLDEASLVFAVFDNSRPLSPEDYQLIDRIKDKICICIINKTDLEGKLDAAYVTGELGEPLELSAKGGEDSVKLIDSAVRRVLNLNKLDESAGFLANERQRECAVRAGRAIGMTIQGINACASLDVIGVMLEQALSALYELNGKNVSDTVIDEVFKRFCVGK